MHSKLGFKKSHFDFSARPQDDFFQYAGGGWLAQNPIPKSESKWGTFYVLRDEGLKKTHAIFLELTKKRTLARNSDAQRIRDFYLSGMDMKTRNRLGRTPILTLLRQVEGITSREELLEFIFKAHARGDQVVWRGFVGQDDKDAETYRFHLAQGGLSLPDRDYYISRDEKSEQIRRKFLAYGENLFMLAGKKKKEAAIEMVRVLSLETQLARSSMTRTDAHDIEKVYHRIPRSSLRTLAPNIPWNRYFTTLGIDAQVRSLVVYQPKFIAAVSRLLETVPLVTWKAYLSFAVLDDAAPFLSTSFVNEAFRFHGNVLAGNEKIRPLWKRVTSVLDAYLGEAVGKEYVKRYFPPSAKAKISALVDDLFIAYERRIKALEWMSAPTKKRALKKLSRITRKLGYPDVWKSYRGLTIRPDDYYGNVARCAAFETKRNLAKLGKKVNRKEWFIPPQTVNAFYDPNMNQIVFPAGILQPPFFDPHGDAALNYGAMGSVIGHELTHGFDNLGAKFDENGNYKNWWTKKDRQQFDRRAKVLVRQFNSFTVGDRAVNGRLTLGENIADLGGLAIGYDAFQLHLKKHGRKTVQGFTPEQRYFLGLAMFETAHARPEFERMLLIVDTHSPAQYRVNGPCSNLESFYKAFEVKPGDKLYRKPNQRAAIW